MQFKRSSCLYSADFEKDACGVGLIANGKKPAQKEIIDHALLMLARLSHRSALGADGKTSDGAGLLCQIPKEFFKKKISHLPDDYAVAQVFLPKELWVEDLNEAIKEVEKGTKLKCIHLRKVSTNRSVLGEIALKSEPLVYQLFFTLAGIEDQEKEIYLGRKVLEKTAYVASFSNSTIVYKGLMAPRNLSEYYPDLKDQSFKSQFALIHSRFSTNTLPAWELSQPFPRIAHNGEINTLKSNRNWMEARKGEISQGLKINEPDEILAKDKSDSYSFDEALELNLLLGRSLPHSFLMLVPEAWEENESLSEEIKEFYRFHSFKQEPWDGPATICFADKNQVGAKLDRNGLRPCRFDFLLDGTLILGSEAGMIDLNETEIQKSGFLKPGEILVLNIESGELEENIKENEARKKPYKLLNQNETLTLKNIEKRFEAKLTPKDLFRFHVHFDEIERILLPMFNQKEEVVSSMGYDVPLAVLSDHPLLLSQYFKQNFAQVTNPPIDPIREKMVMSVKMFLGKKGSYISDSDGSRRIVLESPILFSDKMASLYAWADEKKGELKVSVLNGTFETEADLFKTLNELKSVAEKEVLNGAEILILSDKNSNERCAAIPAPLLISAIHHHLIKKGLRTKTSLILESGELRDTHQSALAFSLGADALSPYLIEELVHILRKEGQLAITEKEALKNYEVAIKKGLLKVMSKLGISTLQSYCGGKTFEILGIGEEVANEFFPEMPSRIGGLTKESLKEEILRRWEKDLSQIDKISSLSSQGLVQVISGGETHQWTANSLFSLQRGARENNLESFKEFSEEIEKYSRFTLRGQLHFKNALKKAESVEAAKEIVKRFSTGAMSFGSLSKEAHESLGEAMNRLAGKSNSGEGGEDPIRYGSPKNSKIKQVASGRFGVTIEYLSSAEELQIKIAQGAKPGEGGQLPGHKVDKEIARIRHSVPGVTLISPPPHHDIYSIEDLAQLIFDLKESNPKAMVSVKLVSEAGIGTIAVGVVKAGAHKIVVSGDNGGTGASPLSSIHHAGVPWEIGLSEVHQTLILNGLRDRVLLETDGQLRNGKDVVKAAILGADVFGFATAPLVTQGCLMMRKCHLNTCPVGVATQDPDLRKMFAGRPEHLINYFFFIAEEVRAILTDLGFNSLKEIVGQVGLLSFKAPDHWKAKDLDLSKLLAKLEPEFKNLKTVESETERFLLKEGQVNKVENKDRAIGTSLSNRLVGEKFNRKTFHLKGTSGQSLGAFLIKDVELSLEGVANDYVGKGLSGGSVSIFLSKNDLRENPATLAGNTCLYGATSGKLYVAGKVGQRFAVRNSGALGIVEGIGDHGLEYMTGGTILILGECGLNFAAGMSGGLAFVFDENKNLKTKVNPESVSLVPSSEFSENEKAALKSLLLSHLNKTRSAKAKLILSDFDQHLGSFLKVLPHEYKPFQGKHIENLLGENL